ncbi:NAD(P) transhydrogenase beta subunit-domain-containing protein [Mycena galopus ATCC 62051]|nr:NAD(P) transhydrogenase beta subunit-domain-containing protein [Mycena galopus ATCC 62051]
MEDTPQTQLDLKKIVDVTHNSVTSMHYLCGTPFASSGFTEKVLRPLIKPTGNGQYNAHSLAHGAGRRYGRNALHTGAKINKANLTHTNLLVVIAKLNLLIEEQPEAYKDVACVVEDMEAMGICKGAAAQFLDEQYVAAGATIVSREEVFAASDILLKVRPPLEGQEAQQIKQGSTVISFLYPVQNKQIVDTLASRKVQAAFAMDLIPEFPEPNSMANIAGYKAVLEASSKFGRFFTGQTTAAGKIPPAKVLVIGAGVAGLSAIVTARRLGAIVRGFDTRSAAREQVQSLGAEFIEVDIEEEGGGGGGYAKVMSKEFIAAEMALFMEQAKDVDIIITTALIPGKPAPKLITNEMVAAMKQGSVIVDLAAEAGGIVKPPSLVAPALHSPLMSVTNAISGMVGVGGLFVMGGGYLLEPFLKRWVLCLCYCQCQRRGGFIITKRMLDMFKRSTDPPEYSWLYGVPAVVFTGGFLAAASTGTAGLIQAGYLASSVLCIGSLSGLSSQVTARQGNALGMLGWFAGVAGIGGLIGTIVGRRVTATELPQMVAMLHSVVGLAAVMTSIGSILSDRPMLPCCTSSPLGVVIGGSIVAFLKLAGRMASKPLVLPGKHLVNSSLLGLNGLTMAAFLTMPTTPLIAAAFLSTSTLLSFIMGYTTTAAIGGADMRKFWPSAFLSWLMEPAISCGNHVLNAYSGFALVAEGFMLDNPLLTTVGSLIGVSGSILSYIMCVAMNRSLPNVLFGGASAGPVEVREMVGSITKTTVEDTVEALSNADSVILVVGYGMAVAKAQYAISDICAMLRAKGITVRFAIHPVAGRMPGKSPL